MFGLNPWVIALILMVIVALLSGTKRAAFAVMKRNFVGYFSNPTGYVFLCIFVFLTSLAAFWPYEFFNQNLATLDQLNYWFPLIMLVFIPAITMSRGGRGENSHAPSESWTDINSHVAVQLGLLTLLAETGYVESK